MLAELRRISDEELSRLRADPSDIFWYLHGTEPYQPPPGLLSRLLGRGARAKVRPNPWAAPPDGALFTLDQSWHAVHFAISGSADEVAAPAGYLLSGGEPLGEVDVGYGPARALLPNMAADFARFLRSLAESDVRERCTPEAMAAAEIYGAIRSSEEFPFLWSRISDMRTFVENAAAAGDSVLVYIY